MARALDVLLGRILVRNGLVPREDVDGALTRLRNEPNGSLAHLLLDGGRIGSEQLEKACHAAALLQARRYLSFAEEVGIVSAAQAESALARFRGSGYGQSIAQVLEADGLLDGAGHAAVIARDPMFLGDVPGPMPPAPFAGPAPAPPGTDAETLRPPVRPDDTEAPTLRPEPVHPGSSSSAIPAPRPPASAPTPPPPPGPAQPASPQPTAPQGPPPTPPRPTSTPPQPTPPPAPAGAEASWPPPGHPGATSWPPPGAEASWPPPGSSSPSGAAWPPAPPAAPPPEASPVPPGPARAAPDPSTGESAVFDFESSRTSLLNELSGTARDLVEVALRDRVLGQREVLQTLAEVGADAAADASTLANALVSRKRLTRIQADQLEAAILFEREDPSFDVEGYFLIAPLGFGVYGPVIQAQRASPQTGQQEAVALEIFPERLQSDPRRFELFRRRAGALSLPEEPSHCRAVDSGRGEGCLYIAWQLPQGTTLREKLAEGPLAEDVAARVAFGVGLALKALASMGLVHGAVRPENIALRDDGACLLRYAGHTPAPAVFDPELPPPSTSLPHYEAPETFDGAPASTQSDLYALGVSLFEAVTGAKPYDGRNSEEIIAAALKDESRDPRSRGARVSPRFAGILTVLLRRAPGERYPTVVEFLDELQGVTSIQVGNDRTVIATGEGPAAKPASGPFEEDKTMLGAVDENDLAEMRKAAAIRRARDAARAAGLDDVELTDVEPSDDPLAGVVLSGRYRLLRKLGTGGMGSVWQANHLVLRRLVALKILHQKLLANTESIKRFDVEVKAASRFQHPHVVQIFDAGEDRAPNGKVCHYMVMECVEGTDLAKVLEKEGALDLPRGLTLFAQVLDAADAAHQHGIVHRDMKSDNIMICHDAAGAELAKIMDFGIAKIVADDATATSPHQQQSFKTRKGVVTGTPQYMSPEQAAGNPNVDHRSDIYSLGIILYELCLGVLPFQSPTAMGYLGKHIVEPPTPFKVARPDIALPKDLEEVILKALEKDPKDRFQTAGEMRAAIQQVLAGAGRRRSGGAGRWVRVALFVLLGGAVLGAGIFGVLKLLG